MSETFVYDGVEVVKTGRTAAREMRAVGNRDPKKLILVEIKPVDTDLDWKKWVDPNQLFIITP
jgi:hypothetical protein